VIGQRSYARRSCSIWKALLVITTHPIRDVEAPRRVVERQRRGVEKTNQKTLPTPRRGADKSDTVLHAVAWTIQSGNVLHTAAESSHMHALRLANMVITAAVTVVIRGVATVYNVPVA